ncbi:MAG: hypothetical protein QOF66_7106 [Mycobacterium sp.]|jgi:hypothetical protein|nr:hypothetical protein [Mycobacterium sp.]
MVTLSHWFFPHLPLGPIVGSQAAQQRPGGPGGIAAPGGSGGIAAPAAPGGIAAPGGPGGIAAPGGPRWNRRPRRPRRNRDALNSTIQIPPGTVS